MEVIHLKKKSIVELEINGEEFIATLDNYAIDHFQRHNKIGLLNFYETMKNGEKDGTVDLTQIIKLLGSLVRYKDTNRIVGAKFFDEFDTIAVVSSLTPVIAEAFGNNLPEASNEAEKK